MNKLLEVQIYIVKFFAFFYPHSIQIPVFSTNIPDYGMLINKGMNKAVILD